MDSKREKLRFAPFDLLARFVSRRTAAGPSPAEVPSSPFPASVLDFEKTYDPTSGGWRVSDDAEVGFAAVELEVGRLWYCLARLLRPLVVFETGTHRGYSTCMIAAAIVENNNNGRVFTFDPMEYEHLWRGTPLDEFIEFRQCPSTEVDLGSIPASFDMLVLDSDHHYETIIAELRVFEPRLRVGGHILMHDSLYFDGVGAAVQQLMADARFEVITLDSPRTGGHPPRRPPGVTIVRKSAEGLQVEVDRAKLKWNVGNPWSKPLLRGGVRSGLEL